MPASPVWGDGSGWHHSLPWGNSVAGRHNASAWPMLVRHYALDEHPAELGQTFVFGQGPTVG